MSFWLNGPVEINDPSKSQDIQILYDYNTMLKYIQQIFQKSKIKLSFTVYNNSLSKEKKIDILDFINNNYLGNEYFTVKYSYDLFNHYLHNSIIIECHPIDQLDKTIGIVVGKRKKLCYNKTIGTMDTMDTIQTIDTLEVDFLCLTKQLRNLHIAPLIISKLSEVALVNYNIRNAYYTIADKIKSPYFSEKKLYHVPIHLQPLIDCGFFGSKTVTLDQIYNFYKNTQNRIYKIETIHNHVYQYINGNSSNKITSHLSRVLCKHIDLFYKKKYTLFDIHTEQDMYSILNNKSFHNFIFYDERDNVSDYICFFQLDCYANDTSSYFKSGFLYTHFYNDINLLQDKLNFVYLKMANENILDMITINNFDIFKDFNYVEGSQSLKYYMYNIKIPTIESNKISMVTI
jgi:hypothetical protein